MIIINSAKITVIVIFIVFVVVTVAIRKQEVDDRQERKSFKLILGIRDVGIVSNSWRIEKLAVHLT